MGSMLTPDHRTPVPACGGNDELRAAPTRAEWSAAGRRGATHTEGALSLDSAGALDEREEAYPMADPELECPACIAAGPVDTPLFCAVCAFTGAIPFLGLEHALHRAGGPQVFVEDDMVAIRVPSYADQRAVGIDLPIATFRWLVQQGAMALHDFDLSAAQRRARV